MNVLFVSSGNRWGGVNPIIRLQAKSIEEEGVKVTHYLIFGKGLKGYINNIFRLRRFIKSQKVDIIHAHFGFSCIVAQLASGKLPKVITLMGTDVLGKKDLEGNMGLVNKVIQKVNLFFARFVYTTIIVKTDLMKVKVSNKKNNVFVIPNGVDTELFNEVSKEEAYQFLKWSPSFHHFIFMADPKRPEKNFQLAQKAINMLKDQGFSVTLHAVYKEESKNLKYYYSAATALLIPSFHEGSPNVVKEALACNCPIVYTNVGDIAETLSGIEGCFMAPFDPVGFGSEILHTINFINSTGRINGRQRIRDLNLQKDFAAKKIINIYESLV